MPQRSDSYNLSPTRISIIINQIGEKDIDEFEHLRLYFYIKMKQLKEKRIKVAKSNLEFEQIIKQLIIHIKNKDNIIIDLQKKLLSKFTLLKDQEDKFREELNDQTTRNTQLNLENYMLKQDKEKSRETYEQEFINIKITTCDLEKQREANEITIRELENIVFQNKQEINNLK